jgi:DNA polymerase III subunit chi
MTRVEFYSNAESRFQVGCQLVAKAFQQRLRVVIYAPDEDAARGIDKQLWTFQATGFIPHCMAYHAIAPETPVVISGENAEMPHHQIMLNLHGELPPMFSRFERLIEVVGCNEDDRRLARARYRHYRDRGYEILHHDLAKSGL